MCLYVLPYFIFVDYALPSTLIGYFQEGLQYIYYLIIFTSCYFFGGIICEEYDYKTGYITFPLMGRFRLLLGKSITDYIMVSTVVGVYYISLGVAGSIFYLELIPIEYILSFIVAIGFTFMMCSLVMFFSSIMKNQAMSIITTLLVVVVLETLITTIIQTDLEPLYSLNYLSTLIYYMLEYPDPRYIEFTRGPFSTTEWLAPDKYVGIGLMMVYFLVFTAIALYIFKKRQLK